MLWSCLICRTAFTVRQSADANQQVPTAIDVPESIGELRQFYGSSVLMTAVGTRQVIRGVGDYHIGNVCDCTSHNRLWKIAEPVLKNLLFAASLLSRKL